MLVTGIQSGSELKTLISRFHDMFARHVTLREQILRRTDTLDEQVPIIMILRDPSSTASTTMSRRISTTEPLNGGSLRVHCKPGEALVSTLYV
jgi:hypothetical protein